MIKALTCLAFFLLFLTITTPHQALAKQNQNATFFSFLKNYLIAYTVIDNNNKNVLAQATKAPAPKPTLPVTNSPTTTISNSSPTIPPSPTPTTPTNPPVNQPATIPPPSDVSAYILQGVNDYRASLGLSAVHSSAQTCAFAQTRAQEITTSFTHDGFYNRVNNHTLPYDSWTRAVENIAETPDYKDVVTLWENSPGHAANMRDSTPYVCIQQNGNYYAYEGMRP